jgi:undecaprenyl-diphosphatase
MSYLQALVIAITQGITELFPISSLGHSVLIPAWIGGGWQTLVTQSSQQESESSFYLAYIVALHCATALALLWYFRSDWIRIIGGFFRSIFLSLRARRFVASDADQRLAWLIIVATIPVGLTGLLLEHTFRTLLAKPVAAAAFLFVNGLILLLGARFVRQRRTPKQVAALADGPAPPLSESRLAGRSTKEIGTARTADSRLSRLPLLDVIYIGILQIFALFAGISRDGITMVGGLWRGLDGEDAARFAFLLATPPILAAGVLKLPTLTGHAGDHIHGQVIVGVVVAGIAAYFSVRFLMRWFRNRTLTPFAIYCLLFGAISFIRFA